MKHASFSTTLIAWGGVVVTNALCWLLAPNLYVKQMGQMGFSPEDFGGGFDLERDAWLKLFACTALVLGYYYIDAGMQNDRKFAERTVKGRTLILILLLAFGAPRGMVAFGVADAAGAFWTWRALNRR